MGGFGWPFFIRIVVPVFRIGVLFVRGDGSIRVFLLIHTIVWFVVMDSRVSKF